MTPAGLVSVNSTESATDGVEKGEEEVEGGPGFRASSPKACTGLMLDFFLASWSLVALVALVVWVVFKRLCCSMLQSAQARSSSVVCSSVALACQHQYFNQTNKRTCITDAADGALGADAPLEPAEATFNANVGSDATCFFLTGPGSTSSTRLLCMKVAARRSVMFINADASMNSMSAGNAANRAWSTFIVSSLLRFDFREIFGGKMGT